MLQLWRRMRAYYRRKSLPRKWTTSTATERPMNWRFKLIFLRDKRASSQSPTARRPAYGACVETTRNAQTPSLVARLKASDGNPNASRFASISIHGTPSTSTENDERRCNCRSLPHRITSIIKNPPWDATFSGWVTRLGSVAWAHWWTENWSGSPRSRNAIGAFWRADRFARLSNSNMRDGGWLEKASIFARA